MRRATLRVRDEPFTLTGRGLGVICELVGDGELWFGSTVTVAIPDPEGAGVEESATVESARTPPAGEHPGLLFRVAPESSRHALLRRLLRPGTTLAVAEAAAPAGRSSG